MTESGAVTVARAPQPRATAVKRGMWGSGPPDVSGYGGLRRPVIRHTRAVRPYGGWFDAVADRLLSLVPGLPEDFGEVDRDELTLHIPRQALVATVQALRDDPALRFEICVSCSGVHYPDEPGEELHAVYHLLSITHNRRLRLEVTCPDGDAVIPSVVKVYPMADWHERETWDMFGIEF
ncbi:MAG: NADH-quinone oxidoreductase subunit C, partial [Propionibacteriaceae bacterium]|nr:NADH-quinone oxidoreductase subunit C [Propionibacteriaceae bacterium]